ncbi:hypothetical protein TSAR_004761 [Trichomalopsis sarcophagae]|uniref:Uncharacterized protein n=1 Tax=Trichomalopsis sarcophagae TaxID=543379 RepID=A0A232FKJ6_9HYME|nr:hypothetical protein TSAR_004761 [Trichomalopsis sarcophagae]
MLDPPKQHRAPMASSRFWEMEYIPRSIRRAPDDEACERLYASHGRNADGRYVLRLPVKPGAAASLGERWPSLRSLHRRMMHDPVLALEYKSFIEDYLKFGHMQIVKSSDLRTARTICRYIVHYAI